MFTLSTSSHSTPQATHLEPDHKLLEVGAEIGARFIVDSFTRRDFVGAVYAAKDQQSGRGIECLMIEVPPAHVKSLISLRKHIHEVKKVDL